MKIADAKPKGARGENTNVDPDFFPLAPAQVSDRVDPEFLDPGIIEE
jgi:hypothetical protein